MQSPLKQVVMAPWSFRRGPRISPSVAVWRRVYCDGGLEMATGSRDTRLLFVLFDDDADEEYFFKLEEVIGTTFVVDDGGGTL